MSLRDEFKWAPAVILERLPDGAPIMEEFDWGNAVGIAWRLPSGTRVATKLIHSYYEGGQYVQDVDDPDRMDSGHWEIEPDAWVTRRLTRQGLINKVNESLTASMKGV